MPPTKSNRLVDIIGEAFNGINFTEKFIMLKERIESHLEIYSYNPSIDNRDLRWVERKMVEYDEGHRPNEEELKYANVLWKKYKK